MAPPVPPRTLEQDDRYPAGAQTRTPSALLLVELALCRCAGDAPVRWVVLVSEGQ